MKSDVIDIGHDLHISRHRVIIFFIILCFLFFTFLHKLGLYTGTIRLEYIHRYSDNTRQFFLYILMLFIVIVTSHLSVSDENRIYPIHVLFYLLLLIPPSLFVYTNNIIYALPSIALSLIYIPLLYFDKKEKPFNHIYAIFYYTYFCSVVIFYVIQYYGILHVGRYIHIMQYRWYVSVTLWMVVLVIFVAIPSFREAVGGYENRKGKIEGPILPRFSVRKDAIIYPLAKHLSDAGNFATKMIEGVIFTLKRTSFFFKILFKRMIRKLIVLINWEMWSPIFKVGATVAIYFGFVWFVYVVHVPIYKYVVEFSAFSSSAYSVMSMETVGALSVLGVGVLSFLTPSTVFIVWQSREEWEDHQESVQESFTVTLLMFLSAVTALHVIASFPGIYVYGFGLFNIGLVLPATISILLLYGTTMVSSSNYE